MSIYDNQYWNERFTGRSAATPSTGYDIAENNAIFQNWVPKVRRALKTSARRFSDGKSQGFVTRGRVKGNIHTEGKLAQSITSKTKKDYGSVELVSFNFERHGVFIHKGVGRGYEMVSGKVIRTAKGPQTGTRVPEEWFNPVLDRYLPELADKLAELDANIAVNATKVKIR
jgi:hypothetical protein